MTRRRRWRGAGVGAAVATVAGLATGNALFLVLAVLPLGYAVVGALSGVPDPEVTVERSVDPARPSPGEAATVTLAVTNEGDAAIPDLHVAADPPEGVPVVDGETRAATALGAGETERVEYAVRPPRGTHDFGDVTVRARNLAATASTERSVTPEGATTLTCLTLLDSMPLRDQTIQYVGRTPTDVSGSGVEFHSVRDYQRGDPVSRIDWNRYASTGELTTVTLREERAMTVVFVLDDRPDAQLSASGYGPDSLDLSTYAVSRGLSVLTDENHRVGVTTVTDVVESWVPPSGATSTAAVEAAADRSSGRVRADGGEVGRELATLLPPNAQVVCCTPLSDDLPASLAETLARHDHAVSVLSPDMTSAADTLGAAVEGLERTNRLTELRRDGVPAVDWDLTAPLAVALADVFESGGRRL